MTPNKAESALFLTELNEALLGLAASGNWEELEEQLQKRDALIAALFSSQASGSSIAPEWLDALEGTQEANNRLLNLCIVQRDAIAKELSTLNKAQKAQSAYSAIANES